MLSLSISRETLCLILYLVRVATFQISLLKGQPELQVILALKSNNTTFHYSVYLWDSFGFLIKYRVFCKP
jgi:hypothetical protein